jgi:gliding motility-associated-like protein
MKSYSLFIFILLFTSIHSFAQLSDWAWAKKVTANNHIHANGITCDNKGNVYTLGASSLSSISFGNITLNNTGCYIAKYNTQGNVVWAKNINLTSNSYIHSLASDNSGNIYVTGHFDSPTFSFGNTTLFNMGSEDVVIAKYDSSGNELWAKSAGGNGFEKSCSIACDTSGNVYITGAYSSAAISFGSFTLNNAGFMLEDIFIAKYDTQGNVLWAKSIGGYLPDIGSSITTDRFNNVFVSGGFNSPSVSFGSINLTNTSPNPLPNDFDIFIAKYDATGNALWAKSINMSYFWAGYNSIASDPTGNLYITGNFDESAITIGNITLNKTGIMGTDFYLAKYDAMGNVVWAKNGAGNSWDYSHGITTDLIGNIYITGEFRSSVFTIGSDTLSNSGSYDVYVTGYDASGNTLWAKKAGGSSDDNSIDISGDNNGNLFITGEFDSPALSFGNTTLINNGFDDIFVAKLTLCKLPPPTITASSPTTFCNGDSVILTSSVAVSYLWSNAATSQSITVETGGIYWVQISDSNGCKAKDSINVYTLATPEINLGNDTSICNDQQLPFTLNAGNNGIAYLWNNGAVTQSITVTVSGIYSVIVSDANNCTATDTIEVSFKPALHISLGNDSIMCPGDMVRLSPGNEFDTYLWSDGSTTPGLNINKPGSYSIIVHKDGCNASDEIHMAECNSEIMLPNVFTPNEDGFNDYFYPVYKNIDKINLIIMNRWGKKIYEGSGKAALWDGKQSGILCPAGVYYYLLDYEEKGENIRNIKQLHGSVTLLR